MLFPSYPALHSPSPCLTPFCHVWLVCLFACAELNVLLSTLFWLPWQIAACCLAMLERVCVYVCVCVCVCAGVLTLYKLLIIMSPSECRHDLHESFSLAWLSLFMLSPVKGERRKYTMYIYLYISAVCVRVCIHGNWQVALSGYALIMCRMSSSSSLFPLFYRLRCCWR